MKTLVTFFCSIVSFISLSGQSFDLFVSSDSVLLGNYIEIKFSLQNIDGNFEAPDLTEFVVLSGPNISSSVQYINGEMSSQKSYSYYIQPPETGTMYIGPSYLVTDNKTLETEPFEINVYPNPEKLEIIPERMTDNFFFQLPQGFNDHEKQGKQKE